MLGKNIQIGWKAGAEQFDPHTLLECAILAEQSGFQSIDVSDHFHPWAEIGQAVFAWTWLGAVAARTKTIEIGTGVTCPILRYHPVIIAQAVATLGCLAPGRVFLGVGTGEALNEYSSTGQWPEYNERQDMLGEAIDLIKKLWSGETVTFDGTYFQTKKAKIYSLPKAKIPLYVSTLVPESSFFAGLYGDGMITVGGKESRIYSHMLQNFAKGGTQTKKDPSHMPKLIEVNVAFTHDTIRAIGEIRRYWAGTMIPALFNQKIYTPSESEKNGEAVGGDIIKKKICISADPQVHIDFLRHYIDLGFTTIFIHSAQVEQAKFLIDYGKHVLAQL